MTAAETMYGRRGGGWAPKPTTPVDHHPEPKARPDCKVCGRTAEEHTGRLCQACWAARSRMAQAKRHAGGVLNDVELAAVRRFPDPVTLTADGYAAVPFPALEVPRVS